MPDIILDTRKKNDEQDRVLSPRGDRQLINRHNPSPLPIGGDSQIINKWIYTITLDNTMDKNQVGQYGAWWRREGQLFLARVDVFSIEV